MIDSRHLNKIVAALLALTMLSCAAIVCFAQSNTDAQTALYESRLFGDEILIIDIQVDEKDWQDLLENPTAKEYVVADLVINGEAFNSVGLRTKGNSSLTQVAQMRDSDRYSLHIKFNKFQKGHVYYGLDTFCLNNVLGDTTYMKDYLSYDIMNYIGVPSPLMNYAEVTVNGEYYGFFHALERYEKGFLGRVFNTTGGQLYNVKVGMGRDADFAVGGGMQNWDAFGSVPNDMDNWARLWENAESDSESPTPDDIRRRITQAFQDGPGELPGVGEGFPQGGAGNNPVGQNRRGQDRQGANAGFFGGARAGRGGGDLVYTDDSISSYSNIFDNAEFKKNSDKDKERVITALKNLNAGTNLERYFDVDEILRYLAAHTVVVNLDSYSTSMAQNYYIYELDGKITILPWDYGLAFGGFQGGNASDVINFPIDTPVSGVAMADRPLISKLLEVPEYMEKYHEYLNQIVDGYFKGGIFEATIAALDAKINEYVKNDATSFVAYEEYCASLPILLELGTLRALSIEGQLDGVIPSTTEGQMVSRDSLISGDGISLSALGTFMGGRGDRSVEVQGWPDARRSPEVPGAFDEPGGQIPGGQIPGGQIPGGQIPGGQVPAGQDPGGQIPGGQDTRRIPGAPDRAVTQVSAFAGITSERTNMILTGILLLILTMATYLFSKHQAKC